MSFRSNHFRRHNSEEEGEIGEEEGEIASPIRTPRIAAASAPSANPSNATGSNPPVAPLNISNTSNGNPLITPPVMSNNNNNNNNNSTTAQPPSRIPLVQHNNRGPRPPPDRGLDRVADRSGPERGFRRTPSFTASGGRGPGWQTRRPWSEQSPGSATSGIQRTPSLSIRNNAPSGPDGFRANDPRNNPAPRPTDPRNVGSSDSNPLLGGPARPTDPRQTSLPLNANVPGESPNRSDQGPPHRSPSLNKTVQNINFVGGRGSGPHAPMNASFNIGPPIRSAPFPNRPGRGGGPRREGFPQPREQFHRIDDPFRRTSVDALDPFGRAQRSDSSSTDTFGRVPQQQRSNDAVDVFGRAPNASIERQHSADGNFRPRSGGDESGFNRSRPEDSSFNRDEPPFNRPRIGDRDESAFNRSRSDDSSFNRDDAAFNRPRTDDSSFNRDEPVFNRSMPDEPLFSRGEPAFNRSRSDDSSFNRDESNFNRSRSDDISLNRDEPGFIRSRPDDTSYNRDDPGFHRSRPDDSLIHRHRGTERIKIDMDDVGFGGRGGGFGRGGVNGPRRFSSYSSLANDSGGPLRIEPPPHRPPEQTSFGPQRPSPTGRTGTFGSPQKTALVQPQTDFSLDSIPRPPFSEGDPRKKAAENRGYLASQPPLAVERQDSRGYVHPPASLVKTESLCLEQPQVQDQQDSRGCQQPPAPIEKRESWGLPAVVPTIASTTALDAPETNRSPTTELAKMPPKSLSSTTQPTQPPSLAFPRRDPRAPENRPKAPEAQPETVIQLEIPKLTCSSLGDPEDVSRAEDAVKELRALVSTPGLVEGDGSSQLPTKQLIMQAMAMLDTKIKDCQASVEKADQALNDAINEEEEEKERQTQQLVEQATLKKENSSMKWREEIEKEQKGLVELRKQLRNEIDMRRQAFEGEKKEMHESLVDRVKKAKSEVKMRNRRELKEQLEHAGHSFDIDIETAQRLLQKASKEAANADAKAAGDVATYQSKVKDRQSTSSLPHLHQEVGMKSLICQIMEENQNRATRAQEDSLAFLIVVETDKGSVDPKHGKTNAEWTTLTRQVTGLADALYTEPSESPFFDQINDAHDLIGPVVKEYVRDTKRRLSERWRELAEEYVVRKTFYEKQFKKRGLTKGKSGSGAKARSHRSSILGFDGSSSAPSPPSPVNVDSASVGGGGRSTNNPYRRARRGHAGGNVGDVVRSEYEQEQIIAELTAKEAMEKRIAHGGSKLPRQVCTLEKELTATYVNTFAHQRVWDPMEEAYEQSITNVWTDMEKCIFLDRFMQHPKDFRKIASFLRNKTTRDCISYYYASKQIVPYKPALKEHLMRRKRRGEYHNWDNTIQAALASGATVTAGSSEDKPLVFQLPEDDNTYYTYKLHPMKREILDGIDFSASNYDVEALEVQGKKRKRQKDPWFILDEDQRKFLRRVEKESTVVVKKNSIEDEPMLPRISSASSIVSDRGGQGEKGTLGRKAHKWTSEEKQQFFDTVEKHGKNWSLLSSAIESKTMAQIKNYFYDHKKLFGRQRMGAHEGHVGDGEGNQDNDDQDSHGPNSSDFEEEHEMSLPQHQSQLQHMSAAESHHEQTLANAELWAQAQLLKQQQEQAAQLSAHEEARRYMQSHTQQQQQVLSSLSNMIPWMTAAQVAQAQVAALQQQHQQHHHHHLHHSASQQGVREWDNDFLMRASNRTPPAPAADSSMFSPTAAFQNMLALRQSHAGHQGFSVDAASQLRSMAALAGLNGMNTGNTMAAPSQGLSAVDVDQLERARAILGYRAGPSVHADGLAGLGSSSSANAAEALGLLANAVRRAEGNGFNTDGHQGNPYNDRNNQHQF